MKCVYAQVNLIEQPAHHLLQDDSPRDNERRIRAQWIQDIPNDRWKQNWNQPKKWTVEQLKNVKYELIKAVSQTFQSLKRPKDHSWQERQWKKRAEVQTQQAHNRRNSPKSFLPSPTLTVPSTGGEIPFVYEETRNSDLPAFKHSIRDFSEFAESTERKGKT